MNCVAQVTVFRDSGQLDNGLWALRGGSRFYFGEVSDRPLGGDFDGDGTAGTGLFRDRTGLWTLRLLTRFYFGRAGDLPAD